MADPVTEATIDMELGVGTPGDETDAVVKLMAEIGWNFIRVSGSHIGSAGFPGTSPSWRVLVRRGQEREIMVKSSDRKVALGMVYAALKIIKDGPAWAR